MSSHDEFSSDDEDFFDEQSEVFLGYSDVPFAEEDDEPTIEDTFIGGQPVWLHEKSTPEQKDLLCDNCHKEMALFLQAFAPLEDKSYDRVIYIFGCKDTRNCSKKKGSVKALRGVCKDPERMAAVEHEQAEAVQKLVDEKLKLEAKKQLNISLTKDLFDATKPSKVSSNPFENNGFDNNPFGQHSPNPFASTDKETKKEQKNEKKVETLCKSKDKSSKPTYASIAGERGINKVQRASGSNKTLPEYPGCFVYSEPEKLKKVTFEPELEKYKDLIDKLEPAGSKTQRRSSSSSVSSASAVLSPENRKIAGMLNDKHFEHFSSIVAHNPSQVLRYNLDGKPLLYNGNDAVAKAFLSAGIPDPGYNPSSQRRFELQLMPRAIIELEKDGYKSASDIIEGMSWGTIIVATDAQDYIPHLDENYVGYVVEYCGVQWEESV